VARSLPFLVGLVLVAGLWSLAAYEWLWIPESSVPVLLLGLVWALAQALIAAAVLAGTALAAARAASEGAGTLALRSLLGFRKLAPSLLMLIVSGLLTLFFASLFAWINGHAIEVASYLTFRSQKPVSHLLIEKIFGVVEGLLWVVIAGFLLSFLLTLLHAGWQQARRPATARRLLASCCFKASFLTSLLSVAVFGGLAYLLANWHPKVSPGLWDYTQMVVRLGVGLVLLVTGWLFWLLSLARLNLLPEESSPS